MKTKKLFQVMLIVLAAVMLFTACSANSSAPSEALTGCWVHLSDKEEDIAILQFFPNGSVITTTYNMDTVEKLALGLAKLKATAQRLTAL